MSRISEVLNPSPYGETLGFKEPTTSKEAARKFQRHAKTLQGDVLATILAAPAGLTADEVAAKLNHSVLAVRPRVAELAEMRKVERSGERRKNASGMSAAVWVGAAR